MSSTAAAIVPGKPKAASNAVFINTLRSEWTKLVTVRSTWMTLAIAAILSVGITALVSWVTGWSWKDWGESDRASFEPIMNSLVGSIFSAILFVMLGVGMVAPEYASGMIRLTFAATPQRGRVLLAKVAVVSTVSVVAGFLITLVTFLVGQAIFAAFDVPTASLTDGDALRALLGIAITAPVLPILGVTMAFVFRSTAFALTAVLALIFAPGFFGPLLPQQWQERVLAYLPGQVSDSIAIAHLDPGSELYITPALAVVVLAAWLVLFIGGAYLVLNRRDV